MPRANILVAIGVLAAFLAGSVVAGYILPQFGNASATVPAATQVTSQEPAPRRVVVVQRVRARRHRSLEREVLIVGGSAAAGAAIGGIAKGGKGAAIGALTGGAAGLIYDLATRNR